MIEGHTGGATAPERDLATKDPLGLPVRAWAGDIGQDRRGGAGDAEAFGAVVEHRPGVGLELLRGLRQYGSTGATDEQRLEDQSPDQSTRHGGHAGSLGNAPYDLQGIPKSKRIVTLGSPWRGWFADARRKP
ncbi:hypothetical protein GCM10009780_66130 [Actinomadura alba]